MLSRQALIVQVVEARSCILVSGPKHLSKKETQNTLGSDGSLSKYVDCNFDLINILVNSEIVE